MPNSASAKLAALPQTETIDDLTIEHPRTLYIPSFGRGLSGFTYASSLKKIVAAAAPSTDVIFGAWVYPDGVASIMLGRKYGLPVVVKCFGSDINSLMNYKGPAWNIRRSLPSVDGFVAVSNPLKRKVVDIGVPEDRVDVVIDGINRDLFFPRDKAEVRRSLNIDVDGPLIVYVGRIEVTKGLRELLDAYAETQKTIPDARLMLVGSGSADQLIRDQAEAINAQGGNIQFAGSRPLAEVPLWMSAADVCTLPSYAEGLPNTVLEALACGRPVVATTVGGIPDILTDEFGKLVPPKDVPALADAFKHVLNQTYDPAVVSDCLPQRDWDTSAAQLLSVLEKATARHSK